MIPSSILDHKCSIQKSRKTQSTTTGQMVFEWDIVKTNISYRVDEITGREMKTDKGQVIYINTVIFLNKDIGIVLNDVDYRIVIDNKTYKIVLCNPFQTHYELLVERIY